MPKPLGKSVTIKISQRVFNENNTNRRDLLCGCQGKVGRVDCVCVSTMHCLGPCVWRQRDDRHVQYVFVMICANVVLRSLIR